MNLSLGCRWVPVSLLSCQSQKGIPRFVCLHMRCSKPAANDWLKLAADSLPLVQNRLMRTRSLVWRKQQIIFCQISQHFRLLADIMEVRITCSACLFHSAASLAIQTVQLCSASSPYFTLLPVSSSLHHLPIYQSQKLKKWSLCLFHSDRCVTPELRP